MIAINSFYLQNLDLLEKFVHYYKEQALLQKHLYQAFSMPCMTKKAEGHFYASPDLKLFLEIERKHSFLKAINHTNELIKIPPGTREAECAFLLMKGKTNKEIAAILGISPRTVDDYFIRLKSRFNSRNKFELAADIARCGDIL